MLLITSTGLFFFFRYRVSKFSRVGIQIFYMASKSLLTVHSSYFSLNIWVILVSGSVSLTFLLNMNNVIVLLLIPDTMLDIVSKITATLTASKQALKSLEVPIFSVIFIIHSVDIYLNFTIYNSLQNTSGIEYPL